MRDDRGREVPDRRGGTSGVERFERAVAFIVITLVITTLVLWMFIGPTFLCTLSGIMAFIAIAVGFSCSPALREARHTRTIAARQSRLVRVCPACEYSLESSAPEPDGCTVCPECGAAWKLSSPDA